MAPISLGIKILSTLDLSDARPGHQMTQIKPEWLDHQLKRWMRPDAYRFVRPDWRRHVRPGYEAEFPFALYERKYSPDQPRVPAGDPSGGQWTSDGGAGKNDPRVISDTTPDPVRPGAQYAQSGEPLADAAARHLIVIERDAFRAGDVLLFRWRANLPAKHAAIVTSPDTMVHAHDGAAVAEVAIAPWWRRRLSYAFSFPGVK
jgi:NlpC/P60 family putative phage cell wall peptidase